MPQLTQLEAVRALALHEFGVPRGVLSRFYKTSKTTMGRLLYGDPRNGRSYHIAAKDELDTIGARDVVAAIPRLELDLILAMRGVPPATRRLIDNSLKTD